MEILNIVAIDDNPNDLQVLLSAIKAAGYGTKPNLIESEDSLRDVLENNNPDLLLYKLGNSEPTLETVSTMVTNSGKQMPILAVCGHTDDETEDSYPDVVSCMKAGALDRVCMNDLDHFKLVVDRSIKSHLNQRQMLSLKTELIETVERSNTLMNSSKDAIAYLHEGMHIRVNEAYQELFGLDEESDFESVPVLDLVMPSEQENFKKFIRNYQKSDTKKAALTTSIIAANEVELRRTIELCPAKIQGEECTQIVIRMEHNPETASSLTSQTDFLEQHDLSSGLFNRRKLLEGLEVAIHEVDENQSRYAMVLLQIDNYDMQQKNLGVLGADQLFVQLGDLLISQVPRKINVARYDTSIFGFLMATDKEDDVRQLSGELLEKVSNELFDIDGKTASCTMSAGAAIIYSGSSDGHELISRCLRSVEKASKVTNHVEIYQPDNSEKSQKLIDEEWGKTLKRALKEDRLKLVFQPIDCIKNDEKHRFTIFVRLMTEAGELINAGDFMPSIERLGLAKGLDRWVLLKSLKVLANANKKDKDTMFFIKLTAGTLQQPDEFDWYRDQILAHNIKPSQLVFELRSDTINDYIKTAKTFYETINPLGCKLAVDGLSSGSEPFKLFKHIDAEYIKIGLAYVKDINENQENRDAIKNISKEATSRGQQLIVTQIENAQQLTTLYTLDVHYVQGNFLRPPSEELDYTFT